MRTLGICALAMALAVSSASARRFDPLTARKFHTAQACDHAYAMCQAKHPDKTDGCRILFEAAKASGGYWGEPAAAAAAHMPPVHRIDCLP